MYIAAPRGRKTVFVLRAPGAASGRDSSLIIRIMGLRVARIILLLDLGHLICA